jgi:thiol-disulfide isomerase/thioredoxin
MNAPDEGVPVNDQDETRRRIGGIVVVVVVFGISIASVFGGEIFRSNEAENRAPALRIEDANGRDVRLNRGDLPTVLLFTEDDCDTCIASAATLEKSAQRWAGKVDFIVVHAGGQPPETPSAQVAIDESAATLTAYSVKESPTVVLVTANGDILGKRSGNVGADTLERQIRALIAEGPKRPR